MELIDTHTHIYCEEFDSDREAVIQRALDAGIVQMLLPAIDSLTHQRQEDLATAHPSLFSQMMGLHPTSVTENYQEELTIVETLLAAHPEKYVAIGEIGLDFYWDTTYKQQQIEVLKRQLFLAQRLSKPVALHLRSSKDGNPDNDAYRTLFNILDELHIHQAAHPMGVLHCYSGSLDQALEGVERGFCLGIGGVLTYKKSELPQIVTAAPLDSILLETDSPYLAPVPYRGRRNESSYVAEVAAKMAEILGRDIEEIAAQTTQNAKKTFFSC